MKKEAQKQKSAKQEDIEYYFPKPMFDFYHKWYSIDYQQVNIFSEDGDKTPSKRKTKVLWRSVSGKIKVKYYPYQIDFNKVFKYDKI